jgi:hypothetical protein
MEGSGGVRECMQGREGSPVALVVTRDACVCVSCLVFLVVVPQVPQQALRERLGDLAEC